MALMRRDGSFEAVAARPEGFDRPWTRRRQAEPSAIAPNRTSPIATTLPRDATPPQPDSDAEE